MLDQLGTLTKLEEEVIVVLNDELDQTKVTYHFQTSLVCCNGWFFSVYKCKSTHLNTRILLDKRILYSSVDAAYLRLQLASSAQKLKEHYTVRINRKLEEQGSWRQHAAFTCLTVSQNGSN